MARTEPPTTSASSAADSRADPAATPSFALSRRTILRAGGYALAAAATPAFAALIATGDGIAAVVAPDAPLETVHEDARWCEGPAWDRRTNTLVFSDVKRDRLHRLAEGKRAEVLREPSNNANGNAFDREGRLLTCEHRGRRVVRQERDGRLTVLADRHEDRRFNSPNDLVVARDGAVWFTDPVFGITEPEEGQRAEPELPGRYLFRLAPDGRLVVAADGFDQPNGLAFSPDERVLYVSEAGASRNSEARREIHAFDVADGGRLSRQRVFARLRSGAPDGLKVDTDGRIYAATEQGAMVWSPAGERLGVIATPAPCANLAFGGADGRRLYLCATDKVHAIQLKTRGWR